MNSVFSRSTAAIYLCLLFAPHAHASVCVDPDQSIAKAYPTQILQAENQTTSATNLITGDSIAARWPEEDIRRWMGGPVQNLGVSEDTPRNLLYRLGLIRGHRDWRRIVLIIGVNGGGSEPACHDVAASIEADVQALRRIAPAANIVVIGVMPIGVGLLQFADQLRGIDRRLALDATAGHYIFVDAGSGLLAACAGKTVCPFLLPDWLHPSPAGYERLGPLIAAAFGTDQPP